MKKFLENIISLIESSEFKRKKNISKNDKSKVVKKVYSIDIFNVDLLVIKGTYEDIVDESDYLSSTMEEQFSNDYIISGIDNRYLLFMLNDSNNELKKLEIIFKKSLNFIRLIKRSKGIDDSETEAYIFGYLCSRIVSDFIDLGKLFSEDYIKRSRRTVITNIDNIFFVISSKKRFNIIDKYGSVDYTCDHSADGTTSGRIGVKEQVILIPKSSDRDSKLTINIWSHELYHSFRNIKGMKKDKYYFNGDLMVDIMNKSLPVLKYLLK